MFHVRRRPADYHPRKRKKKPQHKWNQHQSGSNELLEYRYEDGLDRLPLFVELSSDGTELIGGAARRHRLHPNVTEVGCERSTSQTQTQYLQLIGPNILPRHCVIANTEGIVTVTPCSRDSETYVNGQRIYETTILRNGAIVKFGKMHCFRFLDPYFEERLRQRHDSLRNIHEYAYDRQSTKDETSSQTTLSMDRKSPRNVSLHQQQHPYPQQQQLQQQQNMTDPQLAHNFETTFDVDGNIETRSTSSQGNKEDSRSQRSVGSGSKDGNRIPGPTHPRSGSDAILPAVLEIREEYEGPLLDHIITLLNPNLPSFKLAPAYCLYLMARYRASTHYRPELTPTERAHRLTLMLERVAALILKVIQGNYYDEEHYCDIKTLALWLANSSELLFFLQFDRHLFAFSKDARRILNDSVQISFRHLVKRIQRSELAAVMPHFFADTDDTSHEPEDSPTVLGVLASAMALLRRYRVNVALTVQLFSHLFHYINVWAFNTLIASNTNYCSRLWGQRLKARLTQIQDWAERQGLEISTDTHLARIVQAAHLLEAPKYTGEHLASLSSTCFLLNSLQLRTLLMKYQPAPDEPVLPRDLIDNVVRVAESLADELARSDGREVRLEEDEELKLEFVLPIDSYSCEVVRGIPPGLTEFVKPLEQNGLCRLSTQPTSNGLWTVYMELPSAKGAMMRSPSAMSNRSMGYLPGPQEPEIHVIKLHKSNNGMGLSIVAAKGAGQEKLGIYIKAVVKGGAADADGRLQAGDQLLKVDGQSLVGITQEKAAEYLVRTGPIVTLEVAKQGAIYHGLATLLSQPSPVMTRAERPRPRSELFCEPFRETLPSSYSMMNLHQNGYVAAAEPNYWETSSGGHRIPAMATSTPAGGRRMSERDLPSRISNEQTNQATLLPMHAPLIHSSKSVPSLNSPGVNDGQIVSPVASRSTHEVYNTSYNSTSSTNNISMQHPALRSRSSQNLNDSRSLSNYSQNVTPNLSSRQPSNPNLLQNNVPSPHYPYTTNHQMPQQQHPMYHQHVQQQQMLLHQQQQQQQHHHPYHYAAAAHQQNNIEGERFYQNLNVYRNHEMQNGGVPDGAGGATMMKGKVLSPQQDRSSNQFQRSFRGSQTSLQQPQTRQSVEILPSYMKERPSSAYLQKENYPPQNMTMSGRSQSTRDMLRQEAKLQEMTEEVRRREMKANFSPQQQYPISPANRIQSPGEPQQPGQQYMHHKPPPPEHVMYDGQPARPPYPSHKIGTMRPNIEELGYRESPPPPPPPPTSTHPLYQTNIQRSPDNRYTASVGEPPKGGYYPSSPSTPSNKQQYQLQGTNPWEREEREKEQERRREVVKEWRDQQITELLSLGPNRNQSQEEQLRALRLEKEFERRAQEEEDDDEEDHETVERIQDVMRAAREQDELRNTVPNKSNNYTPPRWSANQQHSQMNGVASRHSQGAPNINEEKERLRRLKDMRMKQVELENMKYEEQRYKQQKEIEDHSPIAVNGHIGSTKSLNRPSHLRLDHLVNNTSNSSIQQNHSMSTNNSYSNITDYSTLTSQAPQQRLDNLLEQSNSAPPPPERGSSFAVMSQAFRSPVTTPSQSRNDISVQSNTPKKVSFQDTSPESGNPAMSTPVEKTLEDPNRFINEAESMLASPKSPDGQFIGATPGVIGTQEVYRDPRTRRLAEQQHQKLLSNKVPVPEKLTFKEKMKMFAMETGEEGTPKDKVKISRAQRDIDNLNSPSTPNAAGGAPSTPTNHTHINKNNTSNNDSIDNKVK